MPRPNMRLYELRYLYAVMPGPNMRLCELRYLYAVMPCPNMRFAIVLVKVFICCNARP